MKAYRGAAMLIAVFFVGFGSSEIFRFHRSKMMTKVHTLEFPMLLISEKVGKVESLLPAGTVLYADQSFPEGFTRYKVYINIDRYPLKLSELPDPTMIAPLEARPLEKSDLQRFLKEYPLNRADLEAILKSNYISKSEVRDILSDYLK